VRTRTCSIPISILLIFLLFLRTFKQKVAEFSDGQNKGFHEYLQAHRVAVEEQIGKLKEIYRKNLTSVLPYSSTPYRNGNSKRRQMLDLDPTSPTISKSSE
jgi:hypothetical protein